MSYIFVAVKYHCVFQLAVLTVAFHDYGVLCEHVHVCTCLIIDVRGSVCMCACTCYCMIHSNYYTCVYLQFCTYNIFTHSIHTCIYNTFVHKIKFFFF